MMEFENQEYQEPEDPEEPRRSFGGLSPVEIGILVVLVLVICVLAGLVGKSFYDNSMAANSRATAQAQIPQPTLTLAPTATPEVTVLPWPTTEPIPEWNKFEFAAEKASLWLPNSYQGGDPKAYPEIVMMTIETYSHDEAFNESVEDVLSNNPDMVFFAFDAAHLENSRIVFVFPEYISPDLVLTMDDYLDELMQTARNEGYRVVGREIVPLENFEAGKLVMEFKVPVGHDDLYAYVKMALYLVEVEDTMWNIAYRTGRDEFPDYLPVIETSINTFNIQP